MSVWFKPFSRAGFGIHSGEPCEVVISPLDQGSGVVFVTKSGRIVARPDFIDDSGLRSTRLASGNAAVGTVEHLMAALWWFGLTDVRVDVTGNEIPILDGSAEPWMRAFYDSGLKHGPAFVDLPTDVEVFDGDSYGLLIPVKHEREVSITVEISFEGFFVGETTVEFNPMDPTTFVDIALARTFAMDFEIKDLIAAGLAMGGDLSNALVIGRNGPLNKEGLRVEGEPVKHKLLDALGDFFLLGGLPRAKILLRRPGHRLLHEIVRRVSSILTKSEMTKARHSE